MKIFVYLFYGGCFMLIAERWFTVFNWQWWLIVCSLAILNALIIALIIEKKAYEEGEDDREAVALHKR